MSLDEKIEKLTFSISDAALLVGLPAHTLRFWESEFKTLKPRKNNVGVRKYSKPDIEFILQLKDLLHTQKYTIKGAKSLLEGDESSHNESFELQEDVKQSRTRISEMKSGLAELKVEIQTLIDFLN